MRGPARPALLFSIRIAAAAAGSGRTRWTLQQKMRCCVEIVFDLAPVISTIISAHCPGTGASEEFLRACVHGRWDEATAMVEGMLAEPWHLKGYQENRLREFLELVQMREGSVANQ